MVSELVSARGASCQRHKPKLAKTLQDVIIRRRAITHTHTHAGTMHQNVMPAAALYVSASPAKKGSPQMPNSRQNAKYEHKAQRIKHKHK